MRKQTRRSCIVSMSPRYPKAIGGPRGRLGALGIPAIANAVSLALGTGMANAQDAPAASAADGSTTLGEITVTAQRRTQDMQDVPISLQVMTGETLKQLNVSTFDDYVKYLPNVSAASNGPGQNEIFMRGLSTGSQGGDAAGTSGLWPNVAVYLDDESVQLPMRNLDVYAADLDRIEVLEGPQGTLFGAGAEAGAIRYITNKPKLDTTEGDVKAGYGVTAHGDPNTNVTAVLNLPLIEEHMAARAVIYDDQRGGYIDNVPATFTRKNTDIGIHYANYPAVNGQCPDGLPNNGYCVPPGSPTLNNDSLAARAINPVSYQGIRAELLYKFDENWDLLLSQSYQMLNAQGVFYQQPNASDGQALQPLEVTLFNPSYNKDQFENTSWNLHGRIAALDVVYNGAYLDRKIDQAADYTNYSRATYIEYYQCYGPGSGGNASLKPTCFSPSGSYSEAERNTHHQEELRMSTPDDWRLRAIAGVYYEDDNIYEITNYFNRTLPSCTSNGAPGTPGNSGCMSDVGTVPGADVQDPGVQSSNTGYYVDAHREVKQTAAYLSADFDIIPKVLTITGGTRYYDFRNSLVGDATSSFGCFQAGAPAGGCANPAYSFNLGALGLKDSETGFKSRGNLTWHVTPDVMLYYTYSQGFRPGGFNTNAGSLHAPGADGVDQYVIPKDYQSDSLTNNEIGWKTLFLDRRLEWNGAVYHENWNNVQVPFFNPGVTGNIFYNTNGQDFVIKGLETSLLARPISGLTVQGAASWNHSRQTNSPELIDNNPASANYGKPITEVCGSLGCTAVTNPYGPIGAPSANAPPMQFSARIRYDWHVATYAPYLQLGATHTDHSFTQAGSNPTFQPGGAIFSARLRFEDPAYSTYSAAVGVAHDQWYADVHAENLANSHASVFTSTEQYIVTQTPLRPRVIELQFGYHF